ncbi:putative divalent cation/proton antiporter TMEM165 [Ornithodoros turicata]
MWLFKVIAIHVIAALIVQVECSSADESQGAIPNTDIKTSLETANKNALPASTSTTEAPASSHSFYHGFFAAIAFMLVSELGDKTFFIAAIMAMRHSRLIVFIGAMAALAVMTVLSALLGLATSIIPVVYTHYLAVVLFLCFGLRMLREAYYMSPTEGLEEYEEVQKSLSKRDMESGTVADPEAGTGGVTVHRVFWRILFQAFTMTFVAEWGDRSQIATVALAAKEGAVAVSLGAILGHSMCTSLAVIAGRLVAQKVSVRTVTFVGGIAFLCFGAISLIMGPDDPYAT